MNYDRKKTVYQYKTLLIYYENFFSNRFYQFIKYNN